MAFNCPPYLTTFSGRVFLCVQLICRLRTWVATQSWGPTPVAFVPPALSQITWPSSCPRSCINGALLSYLDYAKFKHGTRLRLVEETRGLDPSTPLVALTRISRHRNAANAWDCIFPWTRPNKQHVDCLSLATDASLSAVFIGGNKQQGFFSEAQGLRVLTGDF
ncbi:hypothetical protein TcWFU_001540 [Taenia crassiceps]|uniref:TLDc domain-containing protein n=1 Tax=Taenia crassiceps TaxID=6207 RepID=A0ABR4QAD5_9CEST